MTQDLGALSGSQATPGAAEEASPPIGFDPARLVLDELNKGIAGISAALDETEISDTFWYRYWAGYLRGYEGLRDKLRTAIATEAHRAATVEQGAVHEGAGPKDIAQ